MVIENQKLLQQSGGKLLTFFLDNCEYGIQILEAREVVELMRIDPIPRAPAFMKGVINLRGRITPVIDLKMKFGFTKIVRQQENCIIIVELFQMSAGMIVDKLAGVIGITKEDYEPSPKLGNNVNSQFIDGIIKINQRIIFVLAVSKVFENCELIS